MVQPVLNEQIYELVETSLDLLPQLSLELSLKEPTVLQQKGTLTYSDPQGMVSIVGGKYRSKTYYSCSCIMYTVVRTHLCMTY